MTSCYFLSTIPLYVDVSLALKKKKKVLSGHVIARHNCLLSKNPLESEFLSQRVWPFIGKSLDIFCQTFRQESLPVICDISILKHNRTKINVNSVHVIYIYINYSYVSIQVYINVCVIIFTVLSLERLNISHLVVSFLALNIISLVDDFS